MHAKYFSVQESLSRALGGSSLVGENKLNGTELYYLIYYCTIEEFKRLHDYYTKEHPMVWRRLCFVFFIKSESYENNCDPCYDPCVDICQKFTFCMDEGIYSGTNEQLNSILMDQLQPMKTSKVPSREFIELLFSYGARPFHLSRRALVGVLAKDNLLESLLDRGLLDPNTRLQLYAGHNKRARPEKGDILLSALILLRKRGASLPRNIISNLFREESENLIQSLLEWGHPCGKKNLYGNNIVAHWLSATIHPLKWSPSTHQRLTTDRHSATVTTVMLLWTTQAGKYIHILPREVVYLILSELYDMTLAVY